MAIFSHMLPRPYQKVLTGFSISALVGGITYVGAVYDKWDVTSSTPVVVAFAGAALTILRVVAQQLTKKYLSNGNGVTPPPSKPS